MFRLIKNILLFVFTFSIFVSFSQNNTQKLKKEKQKIEQEIKETNTQLNKEKKKKNSALRQLSLSNKNLNNHNKLLKNLEKSVQIQLSEIKKIENKISEIESQILKKEEDLIKAKQFLSDVLYQTYLWKNTYNESLFLISSDNINKMFKRKQYLKQLTYFRKNQTIKIQDLKKELNIEKEILIEIKNNLLSKKQEQEETLNTKINQKKQLELTKNENFKIVSEIKKNEQFYKDKLNQKKIEAQEIEKQIKQIIEEEIRKAREEAEKNNNGSPLTPESIALSSNFTSNKGKLPWPLEKATISGRYGIKKNQAISGVETKNNGIDFSTDQGQSVRVIFDGTVSRIFFIKGKGKAILVNHGSYFTVYSGLKNVLVTNGEKLISKQKIATVLTSDITGKTELHFEIWKGKETQNPVKWLYKAN